ncbi:MAG: AzlD domain-containing protein [Oscillospiraceae bacterium]|nr:AzlD domain-containing protein [Oscillospiraceae bacterium]
MSSQTAWPVAVIVICMVCTILERSLPFLIFRGKELPEAVVYLGRVLPMAIMTTLIFYCMREIRFTDAAACLPQLIAAAVTALLHLWKGNTMVSIAGGTLCCMLLTQLVF